MHLNAHGGHTGYSIQKLSMMPSIKPISALKMAARILSMTKPHKRLKTFHIASLAVTSGITAETRLETLVTNILTPSTTFRGRIWKLDLEGGAGIWRDARRTRWAVRIFYFCQMLRRATFSSGWRPKSDRPLQTRGGLNFSILPDGLTPAFKGIPQTRVPTNSQHIGELVPNLRSGLEPHAYGRVDKISPEFVYTRDCRRVIDVLYPHIGTPRTTPPLFG